MKSDKSVLVARKTEGQRSFGTVGFYKTFYDAVFVLTQP
jgi:hypothetical protein